VIQFMALFTVATGVIVLAGAVLNGRFQRVRETVLLRTLGASRRQLGQIQFVEYAILGVLAAVVGGGLALVGNALLAKFVFHVSPSAPPLLRSSTDSTRWNAVTLADHEAVSKFVTVIDCATSSWASYQDDASLCTDLTRYFSFDTLKASQGNSRLGPAKYA